MQSPSWPKPLPAWFWPWAKWVDQRRPTGRRPASAPARIPAWAWDRYRLHAGAIEAAHPTVVPACPFAGRGLFTVEYPELADGMLLDYVLRAVDAFTWTRSPAPGVVYQSENAIQHEAALARGSVVPPFERALVTNLDPSVFGGSWPAGWTCMPECYWNVDGGEPGRGRSVPNMLFEARKLIGQAQVPIVPVIGCYDAGGENPGVGIRLNVRSYLPDLEAAMRADPRVVGFVVWRVETLSPFDVDDLRKPWARP